MTDVQIALAKQQDENIVQVEEQISMLQKALNAATSLIEKWKRVEEPSSPLIVKSLNEELKQATYIVLEPEVVDLHGDTYSADEVRKACHNFNMFCRKAYLEHAVETEAVSFVESYIAPSEMSIGGVQVSKGTWLVVAQFNDEVLWKEAKADPMMGVSIGCYAKKENLNDAS